MLPHRSRLSHEPFGLRAKTAGRQGGRICRYAAGAQRPLPRGCAFLGVHPGSSKILDDIRDRLGLAEAQLAASRKVLYEYGNMPSATILFVLDELQRQDQPAPGAYGVLMSFGPGLTMEGALVQW